MQNFLDSPTCGPTCAALGLAPTSATAPADSAAASSESVSLANYLDDWHIVEEGEPSLKGSTLWQGPC